MPKLDQWPVIHQERAALASDLDGLTADQWNTPSLCPGWSVQDVLAHMVATAKMTPPKFFAGLIGAGFKFHDLSNKNIASERGDSPQATLASFREVVNYTKHPPGPTDSWLGEVIVHANDIRKPLGIAHEYSIDAMVQVADFYKGSNLLLGTKNRIQGLKLTATDAEWSTGDGPEVTGAMAPLLFAMVGRKAPLDELTGDGLATLRSRS